jgi:hypothetical protein
MSEKFEQYAQSLEANEERLNEYATLLKDFCLSNGLVFLSPSYDSNKNLMHEQATPLPVTLHPTCFPRREFNYAVDLQEHVNRLTHLISNDYEFLKKSVQK